MSLWGSGTSPCGWALRLAIALASAATIAPGQYPGGVPQGGYNPYQYPGLRPASPQPSMTPGMGYDQYRRYYQGQAAIPGIGGGLPVVPLPTGQQPQTGVPFLGGRLPTPPPAQATGPDLARWPSWMQLGGPGRRVQAATERKTPPNPGQCYLVRLAETVEVKPAGETAFYPLHFWDKSQILQAGAEVRLSGPGRATLVFSDGTRLDLVRAAHVVFLQGTEQHLRLDLRWVTQADCRFGSREVHLQLPDGSLARGSNLRVSLERQNRAAPWASQGVEDRLLVRNWGSKLLRIEAGAAVGAGGSSAFELKANRRCVVPLPPDRKDGPGSFPSGANEGLPQVLPGGGTWLRASVEAEFEKVGDSLRVGSRSGDATLQWGGTTFRVPAGRRLVIDPLLGAPFGQGRPLPADALPKEAGQGR